ncbi:hypothetical protein ACP4OV_012960 [Aristida adscensionis]
MYHTKVVWSANRDRPVRENVIVQLTELGDLVLYDADGTLVWFTNTANKSVVSMNLTGSGNIVLFDHKNTEVWTSFSKPTDTLVIGQMLQVGQKLMARTSATNWAKGRFYLTTLADGMYAFAGIDSPVVYYRSPTSGNGTRNIGAYTVLKNGSLEVFTSFRETEAPDYQIQLPMDDSGLEFVRLDWDGHLRLYQWINDSWVSSDVFDIADPCSYPLACGEYGICSDRQCSCPDAALRQSGIFELVDPRELNHGCFLTESLSCRSAQKHCKLSCLNDYAQSYSRHFSSYAFVKVQKATHKPITAILSVIGSSALVASIAISVVIVLRRKSIEPLEDGDIIDQLPGLPTRFSFESLKSANLDFSEKIGSGGSGSVFEGHIDDKHIAVKKLDGLNQGEREFLMEVQTIGSTHRLLVYEYMPNGSLDKWIFAKHQAAPLGWKIRLKIITDVARGLAYLHNDCQQTIAHLDIKPQNILLDEMFTAKISDFGS